VNLEALDSRVRGALARDAHSEGRQCRDRHGQVRPTRDRTFDAEFERVWVRGERDQERAHFLTGARLAQHDLIRRTYGRDERRPGRAVRGLDAHSGRAQSLDQGAAVSVRERSTDPHFGAVTGERAETGHGCREARQCARFSGKKRSFSFPTAVRSRRSARDRERCRRQSLDRCARNLNELHRGGNVISVGQAREPRRARCERRLDDETLCDRLRTGYVHAPREDRIRTKSDPRCIVGALHSARL